MFLAVLAYKKHNIIWIIGVRLKFILLMIVEIYIQPVAIPQNVASFDHLWNKFLSYTNSQQKSSISVKYWESDVRSVK